MKAVIGFLSIFFFLFFAQSAFATNLLLNPGFEQGTNNWSKYGGTFDSSSVNVNSGTMSATLSSVTESTKWIYQVVPVTGGLYYSFSGSAIKNDSNISSILLRVSWYSSVDGGGAELSHNDSATLLTDNSSSYRSLSTGTLTAPDDAKSVRVKAVVGFVSTSQTIAYLDDFTFQEASAPAPTSTPAPTSAPTNTPTPTSAPTSTPTSAPTNTPSPSRSPVPTTPRDQEQDPDLIATANLENNTSSNSVLGAKTGLELTPPPDGTDQTKKPDKVFQIVLILLGLGFIAACIIWTLKIIKKGDVPQNEGQ